MMDAEGRPDENLFTTTTMEKYLEGECGVMMKIKEEIEEEEEESKAFPSSYFRVEGWYTDDEEDNKEERGADMVIKEETLGEGERRASPSLHIRVEDCGTDENEDNMETENTASDPNVENAQRVSSVQEETGTSTKNPQPFHCVYLVQSDSPQVSSRTSRTKETNSQGRHIQVSTVDTNDKKQRKRSLASASCSQKRKSSRTLTKGIPGVVPGNDKNNKVYCKFCLREVSNEPSSPHHNCCAERCKEDTGERQSSVLFQALRRIVPRTVFPQVRPNCANLEARTTEPRLASSDSPLLHSYLSTRNNLKSARDSFAAAPTNLKKDACDPLAADPVAAETHKAKKEEHDCNLLTAEPAPEQDCTALQEPLFIAIKQERIDNLSEEDPYTAETSGNEALPITLHCQHTPQDENADNTSMLGKICSREMVKDNSIPKIPECAQSLQAKMNQEETAANKLMSTEKCTNEAFRHSLIPELPNPSPSGEATFTSVPTENITGFKIPLFPIIPHHSLPANHVHIHSRQRPVCCSDCRQSIFSKKPYMCVHTGDWPFFCIECNKCFLSKNILEEHLHSHILFCEKCKKSFDYEYQLSDHISTHCDENQLICCICNRRFKSRKSLAVHRSCHQYDF